MKMPATDSVSSFVRVVILSPFLHGKAGHEFEYNRVLSEAISNAGLAPVNVVTSTLEGLPNQAAVLPNFWELALAFDRTSLPAKVARAAERQLRKAAYRSVFSGYDDGATAFIIHTTTYDELRTVLQARNREPLAIVLRYDHYDDPLLIARLQSVFLGRSGKGVRLFSDSDALAASYARLLKCEVRTLPIPAQVAFGRPTTQRRVGYFGAMRTVKGFELLPAIVEEVQLIDPSIQFVIQAYRHDHDTPTREILGARERLQRIEGVQLIEEPLDESDFSQLVAECAAMILPYDSKHYRYGTSGVFATAVASGIPVVTSANTWMAAQVKKFDLSGVHLIEDWSAKTKVARRVVEAASLGQTRVHDHSQMQFAAYHSAPRLLQDLLCSWS